MTSLNDVKKKDRFLIPEDTHLAKLYSVVHIGEQPTNFKNEDGTSKVSNQVMLTFEFQDVLIPDGRPAALTQTFTASFGQKSNLRKVLTSLLGGGRTAEDTLDNPDQTLGSLLEMSVGKAVMITVVHTPDGKYANMKAFSQVPSKLTATVTPLVNTVRLHKDAASITHEQLSELPEFVRKKITNRVDNNVTDKLL